MSRWAPSALVATFGLALAGCGAPAMDEPDAARELDASLVDDRDAGHDAGHDAGETRPDAGDPYDAGQRRDSGTLDAGTDGGWTGGECSVVPQAGCAEGEACRAHAAPPPAIEVTRCEPAGPLEEGECLTGPPRGDCVACRNDSGQDLCAAGLYCGDGLSADRCVRYCDSSDDCVPHDGTAYTCQYITPGDPLHLGLCAPPR